jgi:hypothetical protein
MIRKTTLILILCAVVLGAAVYYFDWKRGNEKKPDADASKPAFSIQAADIVSFTLSHPAQPGDSPIRFEKRGGAWRIVQPVDTEADQSAADGIVDQISAARIAQTEPGSADRLKAFGLDPAQTILDFQLANGAKHAILIGDTDFTGASVYAIVDGGKDVALLPQPLSTSAGKSLDGLRDRAILHMDREHVSSFDLKNSSGDLAVTRDKNQWKFAVPAGSLGAEDVVGALLQGMGSSKMASVVSEKPDNLARYGLADPAITFTVTDDKGTKSTLLVGTKDGATYFARDTSWPMIFRVEEDVHQRLSEKFSDLRDKQVLHADMPAIQRIQVENAGVSIVLSRKQGDSDDWVFELPADRKGKPASGWKLLDPIGNLRADEVIDRPAPNLLAALSNPALRVVLTGKDGKELTLRVSKPSGNFVYAQASGSTALYKMKKQVIGELNLKPSDLAAGDAAPN